MIFWIPNVCLFSVGISNPQFCLLGMQESEECTCFFYSVYCSCDSSQAHLTAIYLNPSGVGMFAVFLSAAVKSLSPTQFFHYIIFPPINFGTPT